MNHKHCDIIKDLLPLYVDGLTSEESNEALKAHLASCENCTAIYETLKASSELNSDGTGKELDYLKKIKAKRKNLLLVTVGICMVVFVILTAIGVKTFIIGSPISLLEIGYANDEGYNGIGTKFDPETNELTLYGELLSEQMSFSGIKVEESKRLVGVYNVTVYGVPRFSDSRDHSRRFKKVIKIPDDNNNWSVYSIGEIPQNTNLIWSNAEYWDEKAELPMQKLTAYLTEHKGFSGDESRLERGWFEEILSDPCYTFDLRSNAEGAEDFSIVDYAVSEDGERIYEYDSGKNTFVKISEAGENIKDGK